MTGASPWSVKGISSEERELAKQAARRAGVPIGQWLSRQIREAAEQERAGRATGRASAGDSRFGHPQPGWRPADGTTAETPAPSPTAAAWRSALAAPPPAVDLPHPPPMPYTPPAAPHPAAVPHAVPPPHAAPAHAAPSSVVAPRPAPTIDPARLRDLERRVDAVRDLQARLELLETLERRLGTVAGELSEIGTRIDAVERRAEAAERRGGERVAGLARDLTALSAEVEDLRSNPGGGDGAAAVATSTAPIERAVMRLADRLQRVEELTLPDERAGRGLFARLFRR